MSPKDLPIVQALRELGFHTREERQKELWKMFHRTYLIMTEIGIALHENEPET